MTIKRRFKLDKLIRDKLPEIMIEKGFNVDFKTLSKEEYIANLQDKLVEETGEVLTAHDHKEMEEELADVLEVILALGKAFDISFKQIETTRLAKKAEKGGFENGTYCNFSELDEDHEYINYYLSKPDQYPEIK